VSEPWEINDSSANPGSALDGASDAVPPARIADLLAASSATIVTELSALGPDGGWRPEPGEWSANECLGHLIEAERRGFAGRIRRILAADRPDIPADLEDWDPSALAAARRDDLRQGSELAAEFASLRADGLALVRSLRSEDLERVGIHPEVGPLRVGELLGEWVHHDRNHLRQMLAVTQSRVWAQMGNARRFSAENL
jgi:DinB family protein